MGRENAQKKTMDSVMSQYRGRSFRLPVRSVACTWLNIPPLAGFSGKHSQHQQCRGRRSPGLAYDLQVLRTLASPDSR